MIGLEDPHLIYKSQYILASPGWTIWQAELAVWMKKGKRLTFDQI